MARLDFLQEADCLSAYLREIGRHKLLTREEEKAVLARMRGGDKLALQDLVTANLKFVVSVCSRYRNRGLPLSDLISEGNLGLLRAAQTFEAAHGCRFITYAVWWIRQRVVKALLKQARFSRSPREQEQEREPAAEEDSQGPLPVGAAQQPDGYLREHLMLEMRSAVARLPDPERGILQLYYGLGAVKPVSLEDIGEILRMSGPRVRRTRDRALLLLKHSLDLDPEANADE